MERVTLGRVTGYEDRTNRDGQETVRLLQVMMSDKRNVQTVQLMGPGGEEVNPPNGSIVAVLPVGEAFKIALGLNGRVAPALAPGGKRVYSTNAAGDTAAASVQLDPDGAITVSNSKATISINPATGDITFDTSGEIIFNNKAVFNDEVDIAGALAVDNTIDATGIIHSDVDVTADTISGKTHPHGGVQTGSGTSGPPVP